MENEHRKNLATKQPGIEYGPENNGWPKPLVSEANPVRYEKTEGKSGEVTSRRIEDCKTSNY